jgi:hypothetical protein
MKNSIKVFGITALVAVFVTAGCASMTAVDVEWETLEAPGKVRQYMGFSSSEVKVYAHYKNGDRRQASAFSLSYDKDTVGTQTVKAFLGKGSGSFQCEVMPLTAIRMISPPTKNTYTVGDTLDISGLKVMGTWTDMPEAEIPFLTLLLAKHNFNSGTPGNRVVSVDYKGYSVTFPVTVNAKAEAAAAPAASQPAASQPAASQQPAQQQPSQNQQSLVGSWRQIVTAESHIIYTFNANGTGTCVYTYNQMTTNITWSASGNRLTIDGAVNIYEISGNTLTWVPEGRGELFRNTFTRQ